MAKKQSRFLIKEAPTNVFSSAIILVDRETGVNYLFFQAGGSGGLTPLLGRDGKPVITTVFDEE